MGKSADPGLRQGRGGAWDHRRCGTCFVTMALTLSRVLPCTPLRSLSFRKPSQGKLNPAFGKPFASVSKATLLAPLATFQGNTAVRRPFQAKNTTAICFYGRSRLPQTSQTLQTASHHGHLFLRAFPDPLFPQAFPRQAKHCLWHAFRKPVQGNSPCTSCNIAQQAFPRQPSKQAPCTSWQPATTAICFYSVQGCRLPGLKPLKRSKPSRRHFPGNCQQRLAATCPSHLFLRWFPSRRVMLHVNLPERP